MAIPVASLRAGLAMAIHGRDAIAKSLKSNHQHFALDPAAPFTDAPAPERRARWEGKGLHLPTRQAAILCWLSTNGSLATEPPRPSRQKMRSKCGGLGPRSHQHIQTQLAIRKGALCRSQTWFSNAFLHRDEHPDERTFPDRRPYEWTRKPLSSAVECQRSELRLLISGSQLEC